MALPPWLRDRDLVVLDLETDGLEPASDRVLQIGAAHFLHGRLQGAASALCSPGRPIPPHISQLNGITDAMVAKAQAFPQALQRVGADIRFAYRRPQAIVATFNAEFDRTFLRFEAARYDSTEYWQVDMCVMWLARALADVGRYKSGFRLEQLCTKAGIEFERPGPHDARADAIAAGRLLHHMAPELPDTLHGVLALQWQWERANPRDLVREHELNAYRALGGNAA